jgi:SAM-dependent methyltransferase
MTNAQKIDLISLNREKMSITKEQFYRERAKSYPFEDREAIVRYRRAMKWLDISRDISVREVGCKYSVIRDFLARADSAIDYMAIDIDRATLEKIPNYDPSVYLQHNANSGLPFKDACADYLLCLEVLEHLEDATFFLKESSRVLKRDGKIIISVPNPYCWEEIIDNFRGTKDTEGHIGSYTHQNMDALARFCGLKIEAAQGTFTRIPYSKRFYSRYKTIETNNMFLTRSYMFLLTKEIDNN